MKPYIELVDRILAHGTDRMDRTGVGRRSVFSHEMRFDLADGFPLLTLKSTSFHVTAHELLWMLTGKPHILYLQQNDVKIWDNWADKDGSIGPGYGVQWRRWYGGHDPQTADDIFIDQIANVIAEIKENPASSRLVVSAWNVGDLPRMALPPCHCLFQFLVLGDRLHLKVIQRSADVFLGVPYNIAFYALLLSMVAQVTDYTPGELVWSGTDCHLYFNHSEAVAELMARAHASDGPALPRLHLNKDVTNIDAFTYDDMAVEGYQSLGRIVAPVAV